MFLVLFPAFVHAQDFGVVESAETIDRGVFKIRVNPMMVFGQDGQDGRTGVAFVAGYGLTDRFDMEGGLAAYDGVRVFGVNGEFWAMKRNPFDFSIAAGLHGRRGSKTAGTTGIDLTFLPSKHVNDKLDIYGALDLAFESIESKSGGGDFKTVHLVPGFEYRAGKDVDVMAEVGIALNDDARHYVSAGLAFYFR